MLPSPPAARSDIETKSSSSARLRLATPWNDRLRFEPRPFMRKPVSGGGASLDAFTREMPAAIEALERACRAEDSVALERASAKIRELAAVVGGLRVTTLASQLEAAAAQRTHADCGPLIHELQRATAQFYEALYDEQFPSGAAAVAS